jgi:hypothetical protein
MKNLDTENKGRRRVDVKQSPTKLKLHFSTRAGIAS